MNVLTVIEAEVFYGQFQALFGVSLEVAPGETVAVVGANGAGKSTLLRTIAGVMSPGRGDILYKGQSIVGQPAHTLCRLGIALVPEGRQIFPSLTVAENLMIGAYAGRPGPWNLKAVYELFPLLAGRAKVGGTDLSGGQQQMLAIGRALMSNPDLILMDEISLGLAPLIIKELYQTIEAISHNGTTVVLVEQDINRSLAAAQQAYCLLEGKVSLAGRTAELTTAQIARAYFGI
jgi:branched-chain amino acid transport system ATP-binding protein